MRSKRRLLGRNDDNSGCLLSPFVNNIRERMEGEAYPKAQTFPVDRHGRTSLRREVNASLQSWRSRKQDS
jgi:hypothetical protein